MLASAKTCVSHSENVVLENQVDELIREFAVGVKTGALVNMIHAGCLQKASFAQASDFARINVPVFRATRA